MINNLKDIAYFKLPYYVMGARSDRVETSADSSVVAMNNPRAASGAA